MVFTLGHPIRLSSRASVLCAARNLGEPRDSTEPAPRERKRTKGAFGSLPHRIFSLRSSLNPASRCGNTGLVLEMFQVGMPRQLRSACHKSHAAGNQYNPQPAQRADVLVQYE